MMGLFLLEYFALQWSVMWQLLVSFCRDVVKGCESWQHVVPHMAIYSLVVFVMMAIVFDMLWQEEISARDYPRADCQLW